MTTTQRQAFRRLFHSQFREICQQEGKQASSDYRHQVCQWILGYDKSSSIWTGKEYSLVVDQLKEWIAGEIKPHPIDQNTRNNRDFDQSKKQLIHKIETLAREAGLFDAYIQKVADETLRSGSRPWRDHGTVHLKHLRSTISRAANRKISKRKKEGISHA